MYRDGSPDNSITEITKGVAGRIIVIALLVLVGFTTVNYGFRFGYTLFCADTVEPAPGTDIEIEIEEGETADELGERLYENGIIHNAEAFKLQAGLYRLSIYPGTYKLNTSMSVREMIRSLDMTEQEYNDRLSREAETVEDGGIIAGGDEGTETYMYDESAAEGASDDGQQQNE